jgi:ribosomal protein S18 acetylase RimI-like enzyme
MHLRPLRNDDRPFLLELLRSTPEFSAAEIACAIELLDKAITRPENDDYHCVVATDERDRPSGYACYGPTPMTERTWDLYWIAVSASVRRLGAGRALLNFVEADVRAHDGATMRIETSARDAYGSTRGFYVSAGYRPVGQIADFYKPGDDLVILARDVSAADEARVRVPGGVRAA